MSAKTMTFISLFSFVIGKFGFFVSWSPDRKGWGFQKRVTNWITKDGYPDKSLKPDVDLVLMLGKLELDLTKTSL